MVSATYILQYKTTFSWPNKYKGAFISSKGKMTNKQWCSRCHWYDTVNYWCLLCMTMITNSFHSTDWRSHSYPKWNPLISGKYIVSTIKNVKLDPFSNLMWKFVIDATWFTIYTIGFLCNICIVIGTHSLQMLLVRPCWRPVYSSIKLYPRFPESMCFGKCTCEPKISSLPVIVR